MQIMLKKTVLFNWALDFAGGEGEQNFFRRGKEKEPREQVSWYYRELGIFPVNIFLQILPAYLTGFFNFHYLINLTGITLSIFRLVPPGLEVMGTFWHPKVWGPTPGWTLFFLLYMQWKNIFLVKLNCRTFVCLLNCCRFSYHITDYLVL